MKKLLLLFALVVGFYWAQAQETEIIDSSLQIQEMQVLFSYVNDTSQVWESSIIYKTDFVLEDTLSFNPDGGNDYILTQWYVVSNKKLEGDKPITLNYFQYKITERGVRYLRTMVILYEPKILIERHLKTE